MSTLRCLNTYAPVLFLIVFALNAILCSAQKPFPGPPDNLTASVTLWTSNQCCGAAIGFEDVKPDECLTLGRSVDPTVYGNSVNVAGIWYERIFVGWGYASGFRGEECEEDTKVFEKRGPGCLAFGKEQRSRSFRWKLETYSYLPPGWGQPWYRRREDHSAQAGTAARSRPVTVEHSEEVECKKADWFEYIDRRLGRSRRIELFGSDEMLEKVVTLYDAGNYGGLRELDELL